MNSNKLVNKSMETDVATKYDIDFYGWTQDQAALLKCGQLDKLDIANLIEEVEDMGKSQARQLHNRLEVLLMHLLKWQYQPGLQGNSWRNSIDEQRVRIAKHIEKNPSLKGKREEILEDAYEDARYSARRETGLSLETFPKGCQWTYEQIMDAEFLPE